MAAKGRPASGCFCWIEHNSRHPLATTSNFYHHVLGWTARSLGSYTLLLRNGYEVAGLLATDGAATWIPYVAVDSVIQSLERALQLGAKAIQNPTHHPGVAHTAQIEDPQGAIIGLWEARDRAGAQRMNLVGSMCWNELATESPVDSIDFYHKLFAWSTHRDEHSIHFILNSRLVGGVSLGTPAWTTYIMVECVDHSIDTAMACGGSVAQPAREEARRARLGVIRDLDGATLGLMQAISQL